MGTLHIGHITEIILSSVEAVSICNDGDWPLKMSTWIVLYVCVCMCVCMCMHVAYDVTAQRSSCFSYTG